MIRTSAATINNYKAFCKIGPIATTPATKARKRRHRNIQPLRFSNAEDGRIRLMDIDLTKPLRDKWPHHHDLISELKTCWSSLAFRTSNLAETGATWLELLNLFELRTQHRTNSSLKLPHRVPHPLDKPQSIDSALNYFRAAPRHVITALSTSPLTLGLLKACPFSIQRLHSIGVMNTIGGLAIIPATSVEESATLSTSTVPLLGQTSISDMSHFFSGATSGVPYYISLNKIHNWGHLHTHPEGDDISDPDHPPQPPPCPPPQNTTPRTKYRTVGKRTETTIGNSQPANKDEKSFFISCPGSSCDNVMRSNIKRLSLQGSKRRTCGKTTCSGCEQIHSVAKYCCHKCKLTLPHCLCRFCPLLGHIHVHLRLDNCFLGSTNETSADATSSRSPATPTTPSLSTILPMSAWEARNQSEPHDLQQHDGIGIGEGPDSMSYATYLLNANGTPGPPPPATPHLISPDQLQTGRDNECVPNCFSLSTPKPQNPTSSPTHSNSDDDLATNRSFSLPLFSIDVWQPNRQADDRFLWHGCTSLRP